MADPIDFTNHFALRLKLHKVGGSVVQHAALLKKALELRGIKSEIVKGFCVIPQTREACAHYWVQTVPERLDLDIGFSIAKLRSPELQAVSPVLVHELPDGIERSDKNDIVIVDENERLFDLFYRDPKAFWRETPSFKL